MNCNQCGGNTKVISSRPTAKNGVWRRRECMSCAVRFTTEEVLSEDAVGPPVVRKSKPQRKSKPKSAPKPKPIAKTAKPESDITADDLTALPGDLIAELTQAERELAECLRQPVDVLEPTARQKLETLREERELNKDWWD